MFENGNQVCNDIPYIYRPTMSDWLIRKARIENLKTGNSWGREQLRIVEESLTRLLFNQPIYKLVPLESLRAKRSNLPLVVEIASSATPPRNDVSRL